MHKGIGNGPHRTLILISVHTTPPMRTFSPATDLRTRQTVWAVLKNGTPVIHAGCEITTLTAVEISAHYFKKYGEPLKPLAV